MIKKNCDFKNFGWNDVIVEKTKIIKSFIANIK
jgi:hypothetical protein